MAHLLVHHKVADFAKWKPYFDRDDARRRAAGGGNAQVFRDADDPNMVTLLFEWNSVENAKKFASDPALASIMQEAGVVGAPSIHFLS